MKLVYFLVVTGVLIISLISIANLSSTKTQQITGFGIFDFLLGKEDPIEGGNAIEPIFVSGSNNSCSIYMNGCPANLIGLFKVDNNFFSNGGSHVGSVDLNYWNEFNFFICCNNLLGSGGDRVFYPFITGTADASYGSEQDFGSHVFDTTESTPKSSDIEIGNYIQYVQGECNDGWVCIAKVSPLNKNGHNFSNSHVWDCTTTFPTINMISICYMPETQTDCDYYEDICNWPGIAYAGNQLLYCNFGEDDEQNPAPPANPWEQGHCCEPGEVWSEKYNGCRDWDQCGFNDPEGFGDPSYCYLPQINSITGLPNGYLSGTYFSQSGCVDWVNDLSCCYQVYQYGEIGNWMCDITTLTT